MKNLGVEIRMPQAGQARASEHDDVRFNLFRRREEVELFCAVPEDRPVPLFVQRGGWTFSGVFKGREGKSVGFDMAAAEVGVRLNGFHLFQCVAPIRAGVLLAMPVMKKARRTDIAVGAKRCANRPHSLEAGVI